MRILVIGSGGREHTLVWKLRQSPHAREVYCAPGNAGIAQIATCVPVDVTDPTGIAGLAKSIKADLTVIGPEAPLVAGVADELAGRKLRMVGPSRAAAQLEGSKAFAKRFMVRNQIPTGRFTVCETPQAAQEALKSDYQFPVVIKADGLAAGKGVRIVMDQAEFDLAINEMMVKRVFGAAGTRVVIEECLTGREASIMVFTDGKEFRTIVPAQDFKRVNDADEGPNTGGMGSFSTPGLIEGSMLARIKREIIMPTLEGLTKERSPFKGILFAGLMLTAEGPKVIEFNARLGDPETQVSLSRLESDLVELFEAIVDGEIGSGRLDWTHNSTVCVVLTSGGYPGDFKKGLPISGLEEASAVEGTMIFHAGTAFDGKHGFVTSGGRVLGVTARGGTLEAARNQAYLAASKISFEGMHFRRDIASAWISENPSTPEAG